MITGYVSSDEEDDYDFGYSEPLVRKKGSLPILPSIHTKEIREELHSALEQSKKIELFFKAVNEGNLDTLQKLIDLGVSVDSSGLQEWTPLMRACVMGKYEVVQFLLEHGSNPNLHKELFTPLMACCTYTLIDEDLKLNCVRLLLENGAQVNSKDKYRTTALMYAIGSGYLEIVNELLTVPAIDINVQDKEGWTALFYAVKHNHIEVVEKLVAAGSNLLLKDRCDNTVLNLALEKDLIKVAKVLGYTEETDIPRPENCDKSPEKRFLNELPSPTGHGGFPSDVQPILALFNQFKAKTASLPDFLNMTDKNLYDIGVKLEHDRRKILTRGIHRYHLCPWKKTSMQQVKQVPMSMENAVAVTGNVVKHLTIANASLRYLDTRISSRIQTESLDLSLEKDLINTLINSYSTVERLKFILQKILNHIDQVEPPYSADYIPRREEKAKKLPRKYFYVVCAATAGCLIFYFKP